MKISTSELRKVCMKHPGMWDEFMRVGELVDGNVNLKLERGDFKKINTRFRLGKAGTVLHAIFNPVVKTSDAILGTKLAECGGCGARELKINDAST